ncbi:MAG: CAP domain-containing protein, partial [Candidatus Levybacteria bacterium]|nr:CAP domain-containing protein [Candidatus Levybacteria bacterium]
SEESKILNFINDYRRQNGLSSLSLSSYLNRAAEWKSKDMVMINDVSKLAHSDSTGRKYNQMIYDCGYPLTSGWVGENLAANSYKDSCSGGSKVCTADKAFDSWKKSPLHNENLLTTTWTKIGIARNVSASGIWYWSTEFGDHNDGTDGSYITSILPTPTPAVVAPSPTSQTTCVNQLPGSVTFNWTQQQSSMCYEIYYTYSGGSETINAGCNISSYPQPGFSPGLVVTWQVRAFSGTNVGPYTPSQTFTVPLSCSTTSTPTPTPPPPTTTTCSYTSSNNLSIVAGTNKTISVSAVNLNSGTTDLGFTSGTDKLFKNVGNTIAFNSTMSLSTPISSYTAAAGASYTFNMNLTTTTLTPLGQYTLDAVYLYLNGVKTQCTYNGLGGLVINVTNTSGGGGGGSSTPTPTPTKVAATPTATPTPTKLPTPTPISYTPTLQLWNAFCSNGAATIAFNWSGSDPYGFTLKWGSPSIGSNTQTIYNATSGRQFPGFSSNVGVEYQVWGNNSSGVAAYPSSNGTFIQTTPNCYVAPPTPTPTPTPALVCSPNSWCGSACLSQCYTSDIYCNSTGTACNVQVGNYYGNWCGCPVAPTPTPVPVQVCSPYSWCGSACVSPCYTSDLYCNSTGTACNVQVGNYYGDWCGCGN